MPRREIDCHPITKNLLTIGRACAILEPLRAKGGMAVTTVNRVLAALIEADGAVSGEWLARKLGVTRNAVWKAIARLREEGYQIEAATNRGYRLVSGGEPVSEAGIRA